MKSLRYSFRLLRIWAVLARYDALFFLAQMGARPWLVRVVRIFSNPFAKGRDGERLARALRALGPTFIKLGQTLAARADFVGEEVAADLSMLQDKLPAFPFTRVQKTIEQEFEQPLETLFPMIETEPVAAASIAQVHLAQDADGQDVAVKVLRPGIEKKFARDIALFMWLAASANKRVKRLKRLKLVEVVEHFAETVRFEMDLRLEAAAAEELRENLAGDDEVVVPEIQWQRTSQRVLTLERVQGIRIDKREALTKAGHDLNELAQRASSMFFKQVFRDGFFHADMHPGNVWVNADGQIVLLDFGIMGRLDSETRLYVVQMMQGFYEGDYRRIADLHFDAGYVSPEFSRAQFAQACRAIGAPLLGQPQEKISLAQLLAQMFAVTEAFEMETQPHLLLLQKTMVLGEGIGRQLCPQENFWELARPLVEKWVEEHLGAKAQVKRRVMEVGEVLENIKTGAAALSQLPTVITEDGIRLHPDTVASLKKQRDKGYLKTALVAAITAGLTIIATVVWL